jgi:hypothetical protein
MISWEILFGEKRTEGLKRQHKVIIFIREGRIEFYLLVGASQRAVAGVPHFTPPLHRVFPSFLLSRNACALGG